MKRLLLTIILLLTSMSVVFAQDSQELKLKGKVVEVNTVECEESVSDQHSCYTYTIFLSSSGQEIETMTSMIEKSEKTFKIGDPVYVIEMEDLDGTDTWSIVGYVRGGTILFWSLAFVVLAFLIGGKKSLGSILSLILSFVSIYFFIIPSLLSSGNILPIGYVGVFLVLTLSMYLAHGFKKQTTIALVATYVGVTIVSILTWILMESLHINGMGEETAFLLSSQTSGSIDVQKLFFIAVLIGAVGVLDDVAIGQVSSMHEIYQMDKTISHKELYRKTMNIGREHVASMINTLFIVYAGSSLSLVMLMYLSNRDMGSLVSIDMITEEIVRTLAISIALLLVVPISTYISSMFLTRKNASAAF